MKRLIEDDSASGFDTMLGEKICLFCGVYFYTGELVGVNSDHLELKSPKLIYETGELSTGGWKNAQDLPSPWRVMLQGIESWGPAKC